MPPSYIPAILGGVLAWAISGQFHPWYFVITVFAVTVNHIALNMTDDYFDFKHSVDQAKEREKNPYSGGSGTLTSGLITPGQMATAFTIGYLITIMLGVYLTIFRGWQVFAFGVFGIWCAYFYTAPPIRYGYHGFGELSQLVNFSITIGMGMYFVQTQSFSLEALLVLLPLGFMMFAMITINEIPDRENDRDGEKKTLVVQFGAGTAVQLYGISMVCAYLILLMMPILGVMSYWVYISLLTLPWFVRAYRVLHRNYQDPAAMAPANILTIKIHNVAGILLIVAYLIDGFLLHGFQLSMLIPMILLVVLYLPVVLTVFLGVLPVRPGDKILEES